LKEERKARRAQSPGEKAAAKQKPCDVCSKRVDLLVRCMNDDSGKWRMLCGRCWKCASGGVPDGDAEHPHYRYGGLWKNRAATASAPKFSPSCRLAEGSGNCAVDIEYAEDIDLANFENLSVAGG